MAQYSVLAGQTITDAVLNSCGDISAWSDILVSNDMDSWTPSLYSGQILDIPTDTTTNLDNINALKSYPANNFSTPDIYEQIDTVFGILAGAMSGIEPVIEPVIIDTNTYYEIRQGETIVDAIQNSSGNIINWDVITQENGFDWTPDLYSGELIKIPALTSMSLNNFRALNTYPSNNFSVPDVYEQIFVIFELLSNPLEDWILANPVGYWNDNNYWRDGNVWID